MLINKYRTFNKLKDMSLLISILTPAPNHIHRRPITTQNWIRPTRLIYKYEPLGPLSLPLSLRETYVVGKSSFFTLGLPIQMSNGVVITTGLLLRFYRMCFLFICTMIVLQLRRWSHRQIPSVTIHNCNNVKSGGPTSISQQNLQQFHGSNRTEILVWSGHKKLPQLQVGCEP